jgi:hypothetical protein
MTLKPGDLAIVGESVCTVIWPEGHPEVPEDHVAVWYGDLNASGVPKIRTVPVEYVTLLEHPPEVYH